MRKLTTFFIVSTLLVSIPIATSAAAQVVPKGSSSQRDTEKPISQEQYRQEFRQAVKSYRKILRKHWPDAEISSQHRLILYSDDFQEKRAVDFKQNEIQVTLPTIRSGKNLDYLEMQKKLNKTLTDVLSMDLQSAIKADPINMHMQKVAGIRYASDLGKLGRDLILSELFRDERPSIRSIQRMAEKLTKEAYIRYPAVASLKLSYAFNDRTTYIVPLPEKRAYRKAKRYKPFIFEYAKEFNLPSELLFAIIHSESHFNPLARSQVPAFGLMQIVPHTAGKDAANLLFKKDKLFSPAYLYNPKKNVQVGTAYFHILYYRYLKDIQDPKTRMYCAIAAYNAGTQNVMKTLTGRRGINSAVPQINRMSADDVLKRLLRQLPSKETRDYLNKVLSLQKNYVAL